MRMSTKNILTFDGCSRHEAGSNPRQLAGGFEMLLRSFESKKAMNSKFSE